MVSISINSCENCSLYSPDCSISPVIIPLILSTLNSTFLNKDFISPAFLYDDCVLDNALVSKAPLYAPLYLKV